MIPRFAVAAILILAGFFLLPGCNGHSDKDLRKVSHEMRSLDQLTAPQTTSP